MFIGSLPISICSGVRMFWERELDAHMTELAQYAGALRDQLHEQIDELQTTPRKSNGGERCLRKAVMAAIEERDEPTIGSQSKSGKKKDRVLPQDTGQQADSSAKMVVCAWGKTITCTTATMRPKT